jgi:hypothetical protein
MKLTGYLHSGDYPPTGNPRFGHPPHPADSSKFTGPPVLSTYPRKIKAIEYHMNGLVKRVEYED